MTLDYGGFDALTFDCYGTLIDWEAGLLAAFRPGPRGARRRGRRRGLLGRYARHEAAAEAGPYLRYRDVLVTGLRGVGAELGFQPTTEKLDRFSGSVADWPAFPDSAAALARLAERSGSGSSPTATTTCSRRRTRRLGVDFDWVVTAQQARSYKPNEANFQLAFERIGRAARADPPRGAEPVPRSRAGQARSACRASGSIGGTTARGPARRRPPRRARRDVPRHGLVRGRRDAGPGRRASRHAPRPLFRPPRATAACSSRSSA